LYGSHGQINPDEVFFVGSGLDVAEFVPACLALALFSFAPIRPLAKGRGGSSVVCLTRCGAFAAGELFGGCALGIACTPAQREPLGSEHERYDR